MRQGCVVDGGRRVVNFHIVAVLDANKQIGGIYWVIAVHIVHSHTGEDVPRRIDHGVVIHRINPLGGVGMWRRIFTSKSGAVAKIPDIGKPGISVGRDVVGKSDRCGSASNDVVHTESVVVARWRCDVQANRETGFLGKEKHGSLEFHIDDERVGFVGGTAEFDAAVGFDCCFKNEITPSGMGAR